MSADNRADVLARAARSLREEQDAALAAAADPTWTRILTDVRRARVRRRWLVAFVVHLGIGLAGVGVWAIGGRITASKLRKESPAAERAPVKTAFARRPPVAPVKPDEGIVPEVPPEPAPESLTDPEPSVAPRPARAAPARAAEPPRPAEPPPPAEPPARAVAPVRAEPSARAEVEPLRSNISSVPTSDPLYREAHRLHFVRRDFAAALAAWDRYLARGAGPLVLEARYNRAIALAHLGRHDEAIDALRPFADGAPGAYRQAEARALIDRFTSGD